MPAILHLTVTHELFQMPHEVVSQHAADFASSELDVTDSIVKMSINWGYYHYDAVFKFNLILTEFC